MTESQKLKSAETFVREVLKDLHQHASEKAIRAAAAKVVMVIPSEPEKDQKPVQGQ